MKTHIANQKNFVFISLAFLMVFCSTQRIGYGSDLNVGEPRTVRLIYFLPNDHPYDADAVQNLKDKIRIVQDFYAEQMQAHGYGDKTFRIETDAKGEPMVHRVNGEHPFSRYDNTLGNAVISEIQRTFDFDENIYFIVLGAEALRTSGGEPVAGVGRPLKGPNGTRYFGGGAAVVANEFSWQVAAHELGHVFGLWHDFRDDAYIMSYGPGWNRLSACTAGFLAVHPYFNLDAPIQEESGPAIELISQQRTYPPGTTNITVQLKVSDSEGLHQVLLYVGGNELKAWQALGGEQEAVVEFEYDGVIPSDSSTSFFDPVVHIMNAMVVDTDGNISWESFGLSEVPPSHIAALSNWGPVSSEKFSFESTTSVAFSPDGTTLAIGSRSTRLWNMATRELATTLTADWDFVNSVAFSPDGTLLASAVSELKDNWVVNGRIQLWDVATRQNITTLIGHTDWVASVVFSPDGKLLASGSDDDTIKLWDIATKQNITTLETGTSLLNAVVFSPDGKLLASAVSDVKNSWRQSGRIQLWDVATQQNIVTFEGHERGAFSVAFSPDGTLLVSGDGSGTIKLWDLTTKKHISDLSGHTGWIEAVAFSPDGKLLASGARDHTVKLWNMKTRASVTTLKGHTHWVQSVAFSPDGAILASGAHRGVVMLWDVSKIIKARTEVNIPDAALRAKIAETLGKPNSPQLTAGDMLALRKLNAPNANIQNLTGLEHAHYLRELNLSGEYIEGEGTVNSNAIADLSPLSTLTQLISLNLSNIGISDISVLAGLTQLKRLYLWNNTIQDVSSLKGLTQLTSLDLDGNVISDISALSGLTQLTSLDLRDNAISDVSPLVELNLTGTEWSSTGLYIENNPLNYASLNTHIPAMLAKGIKVSYDLNLAKITGPWLWMIAPTERWQGGARSINIDSLAAASAGAVTEAEVAANGAKEGDTVGDYAWQLGEIAAVGGDNINDLLNSIGMAEGDINDHSSYALITLESATAQSGVPMRVGSDDAIKVWLNEVVVHNKPVDRGASDFQDGFTVDLEKGDNLLLVKVSERAGAWSMFVGIKADVNAVYKRPPDAVLSADVNGDGIVNIQDLVMVSSNLGQMSKSRTDVNGDGVVNIQDLVLVAGALGEGAAAAPTLHALDLEGLTAAQVQDMLTQARQMALTDPAYLRGVEMLEQLLDLLLPKETALLPNYPNPFNPETWIPYQLAKPADVTLHIYAVNGALVRRLALGYQPAGMYHNRNQAAYWDGRNEQGEAVASGVYFYTLTAGNFTATRKMLIRQ